MKISPPWVTYVNELMALFGEDPEINIKYENELPRVKLYVSNWKKATALGLLLKRGVEFGNIYLYVEVIPPNTERVKLENCNDYKLLFEEGFKGNPAFSFIYQVEGIFSNKIIYVVFKNKVIQFFNDNLNDVYGNISTLYQEIAKDVFDIKGICYCTDAPKEILKKPLGEWP